MDFAVHTVDLLLRQGHWREMQTLDHRATCWGVGGRLLIGKSNEDILLKWALLSSCLRAFTDFFTDFPWSADNIQMC